MLIFRASGQHGLYVSLIGPYHCRLKGDKGDELPRTDFTAFA